MTDIISFAFDDALVRVTDIDGEPWVVATDVAKVLGHRDALNAVRYLDDDEKGTLNESTPRRPPVPPKMFKGWLPIWGCAGVRHA